MRSVDTNIVVRFLARDDEHQFRLANATLQSGDVWIAKTVLLETEWVLRSRYRLSPGEVHLALSELLGLPGMAIEDPRNVAYALELFGHGLEFADALHLASRPDGASFITFDEALVRRAKKAGATRVSAAE